MCPESSKAFTGCLQMRDHLHEISPALYTNRHIDASLLLLFLRVQKIVMAVHICVQRVCLNSANFHLQIKTHQVNKQHQYMHTWETDAPIKNWECRPFGEDQRGGSMIRRRIFSIF
jgi:hypothetical protein